MNHPKRVFFLQNSALELLRLLNRCEFIDFFEWGIDMLVNKLNNSDQIEIRQKALNVIKEVVQEKKYMEIFFSKNPNLQDLCDESDPFLITLLQTEEGFNYLSQKYDWISQELFRWQETEKIQYVTKIEKCLLNALNFVENEEQNIFRFPDIVNNPQNSLFTLGFIHRMPWIMNVDFSTNEFKDSIQFLVSIQYQGQQNLSQFVLCGRPTPFILYIFNSKFQINFNLSVGKSFIDKNCNELPDPSSILVRCDFSDSKQYERIDNNLIIKKGGIHFIFLFDENSNTVKLTQIKLYMKVSENKSLQEKVPQHFFGELVKTTLGKKILRENRIIEQCVDDIRNYNIPILNKRASLWAIGNIGYSIEGIDMISNLYQNQIVQDLVRLAEQSDILSLRGTCLYILNMLANTELGRSQLKELDWISHWNQNIGWLVTPNNMRQFFYIRNTNKEGLRTYWPNQNENWDRYISFQKKVIQNNDQSKLLQNIALMSNALSSKNASMEIKKIYKSNPGLFEDKIVIYSVILMLDFYKFRFENRKFIFNFFEKAFSNQEVFSILDQNPYNDKQSL
ncbi:hypothetical protein IMG5_020990 [Ichthyophthirius multifiliis]|uniref:Rapamycin-insensitive companion of mTOR domain-containing protein n=1 Tax=Ichthyophthirius multifiliis TaxID=5932 RepID=G0QKR2_ICHMU|nr:hypothetical protein IMG5_020990 [Ichthyophthirius multifiliis]EGR34184.1 hypothetical protein IMG5_020990 [Ichthyophthirius multifiliis]|eukprot:XP_004039488.1 hypothetical protein IMG5_020990 [Ichthyophthirius multifiliis]